MTMHKETLRNYLHNFPLVQAVEQKRSVDDVSRRLLAAVQVMREAGVPESAAMATQEKYDEYRKISRAYGNMIEDTWGVTWQAESVIAKYTSCCDDDIDRLPDNVRD